MGNCNSSNCSAIISGVLNCICGSGNEFNFIGGGHQNYIYNCNGNGIFSGTSNKICNSLLSVVFGGDDNLITECNSVIGGGKQNCVMSNCSNILGGRLNSVSGAYSSVLGGQSNNVVGIHSGILGGCNNSVLGSCSAILGGCNNHISAALNFAGIFGCNITAVTSCALHANNFVAQNMPTTPGLPGTFYKTTIGSVTVIAIS